MTEQTTISVSGSITASIRALVSAYPGTNANRMGRALVRIGLRVALRQPESLIEELRQLDTAWGEPVGVDHASR